MITKVYTVVSSDSHLVYTDVSVHNNESGHIGFSVFFYFNMRAITAQYK